MDNARTHALDNTVHPYCAVLSHLRNFGNDFTSEETNALILNLDEVRDDYNQLVDKLNRLYQSYCPMD